MVPPKTEYSPTELGQTLVPLIKGMGDWGYAYFDLAGVPAPCEGVNPFAEEAWRALPGAVAGYGRRLLM